MYKKAVKITEENLSYICDRFEIAEEERPELLGFYLVTDFGDEDQYSFLNKIALDKLFEPTDRSPNKAGELDNGFFEIKSK